MSAASDAGHQEHLIPVEVIREQTQAVFKKSPCLFQIELCRAQLCSQHTLQDIISTASTGSGKTLSFLMPLLFNGGKITIIVTALNLLGEQFGRQLESAGIAGISITASNANRATFEVCGIVCDSPSMRLTQIKAIRNLEYRVVIINPEILMQVVSVACSAAPPAIHAVSGWTMNA